MDLEARLRAFAAVARRGSFSAAAADLGISQPAISKHVADLEAALGTRLVVRGPRGARLTEAGEFLASHVSRAEALLARAAAGMAALADAESGRLVVAASGTPGVYLVPKAVGPFTAARPGVDLDVRLGTSATALALIRGHVAELGVVGGTVAGSDVEVEPLIEDEIVIVGPPSLDGKLSPRDLERYTWISREEGSGTRAAMERAMESLALQPARRLELPDWEMVKGAVAAGAGIAAISRFAVEHELRSGRLALVPLRGWHVVRPLAMVYSRDVPLSPLGEHFAATLRRVLGHDGDAAARARAALAYAERADGRASMPEIQQALEDGIRELTDVSDADRALKARLRSLLAFWQVKDGELDRAATTLETGLAEPRLPDVARADLLARQGWLAGRRRDDERAARLLEDALSMARACDEAVVVRRATLDLATAYSALGRHDEARCLLDDAVRLAREAADDDELLRAYNNGAVVLEGTGDPVLRAQADDMLLEGAEHARRVGDRHHVAWMQMNAAVGLMRRGRLREAERRLEEALELFEALGEHGGVAPAANTLAWVRTLLGSRDGMDALLAKGSRDRYRGSDEMPIAASELRALIQWRSDPSAAVASLQSALETAADRGDWDTARGWLTLARLARRTAESERVSRAVEALAQLELITPEERCFPDWVRALGRRDRGRAVRELASIASALESLGSVLDAADAYSDAELVAARRADIRHLRAERDRLLSAARAVSILDADREPLRTQDGFGSHNRSAPPPASPTISS